MLENTFLHAAKVGLKTEQELWDAGILSWDDLSGAECPPLSSAQRDSLLGSLDECRAALAEESADFFYDALPPSQHWRLFPHFRSSTLYLDIETTGLGGPGDYITTIATYDGTTIRHFIHDDNLLDFKEHVQEYKLLVTYNGKSFDLPFIRSHLGANVEQAHLDLRFPLASLGYRGGLKNCEKTLGIAREGVEDVDGYFAVVLWHEYNNTGNRKALETLLAYNMMDTVNLERLAVLTYNLHLTGTPFADSHHLVLPEAPPIPFQADASTIADLRGKMYG